MKKLILILGLLVLASCVNPEKQALLSKVANQSIICGTIDDCEVKWGRSILWITQNSHWKIRQQTEQLITTEGPLDSTEAAFVVNKIPLGGGKYQIDIQAACGNPFGCVPETLDLRADFVQFVLSK
ncbi:MAG: hypothetical protein EPN17_00895 [Methylobacter sp.]|nr:MAG: hypothetical protein EPN17_00895 [Methylobacter sp.]